MIHKPSAEKELIKELTGSSADKCSRDSLKAAPNDPVNNPSHYTSAGPVYETIKVIEAWGLGFCLGNTIKYISRAGKKDKTKTLEDLKKARWYLDREIKSMESE